MASVPTGEPLIASGSPNRYDSSGNMDSGNKARAFTMKIRSIQPRIGADYIRKARTEILAACGELPRAEATEPIEVAIYLFAFEDHDPVHPIGMAEVAFHDQVYESFDAVPYRHLCDLRERCDLSEACGIRTIYANPTSRQGRPTYFGLAMAATHVFRMLGARYATATTDAKNTYLNRLYQRTGGEFQGTFAVPQLGTDVALYLFDLEELTQHRAAQRYLRNIDVDMDAIRTARNGQLACAHGD